jgi:hypothetical protein
MLKKIERGEVNDAKIEAARATPCIKVGVVMDDKIVSIDMPWATIRASAEPVLSAFVLKQMQEAREH